MSNGIKQQILTRQVAAQIVTAICACFFMILLAPGAVESQEKNGALKSGNCISRITVLRDVNKTPNDSDVVAVSFGDRGCLWQHDPSWSRSTVRKFTNVKQIALHDQWHNDVNEAIVFMNELSSLEKLENFEWYSNNFSKRREQKYVSEILPHFPKVRSITIGEAAYFYNYPAFTKSIAELLAENENLEELTLYRMTITNWQDFLPFEKCHKFSKLDISRCPTKCSQGFTDEIEPFLPNLKTLILSGDENLGRNAMKSIVYLQIKDWNRKTNLDLSRLFPNLEVLALRAIQDHLCDDDFALLSEFRNLKKIILDGESYERYEAFIHDNSNAMKTISVVRGYFPLEGRFFADQEKAFIDINNEHKRYRLHCRPKMEYDFSKDDSDYQYIQMDYEYTKSDKSMKFEEIQQEIRQNGSLNDSATIELLGLTIPTADLPHLNKQANTYLHWVPYTNIL